MKKLSICTVFAFGLSLPMGLATAASDSTKLDKNSPHSVGVQLSAGGADYKNKGDADDNVIGGAYIYYNYQFADNYSVELGFSGLTDVDNWKCDRNSDDEWVCTKKNDKILNIEADKLDYSAFVIAAKGNIALSKRNSLYGKLGANFYNYELTLQKTKVADDDGVGLFLEAGWEYRWDNGIGMNAGIQYQDAGDLEISTSNIGISYRF
ncbi:outer membrane beta-barrel protein [Agaribacter marinus]|uniref:Membrane protein n=1 Tax=Agaribacter marinus TaxID=1431249 RepID=A0AA37SVR6_9ALTE|nr:outer membrane beta-barrel protein [Agaribacter marinus]GLR70317.1 membrane protein [Agaribacter marinus]